ncbi:hypothetical protein OsJ_03361 [Oryza sativa Japonica Group]|uniref:NADPH-dependent diflavin oxidoreductase 1 n=1 Tax=Oryza sativa subsp. japonica TaxID=39947 RepID=B9EZJ9_ORYSJ|nr:hypothetical protein OsJ_03361 [Oryza sativa Japonica Group]
MAATPAADSRLLVIYASETGNAMDAAERVGRQAERGGCPAVDVLPHGQLRPLAFRAKGSWSSSFPPRGRGFWRYLLKKNLGARWLEGVRYAVFGLGDSGYQKYNFAAKKLDKRLLHLGAEPIIQVGLGDDQHPSGYEGALDPWLLSLWESLNQTTPSLLPRMYDIINPDLSVLGDAKVEVIYHSSDEAQQDSNLLDFKNLIQRARSMSPSLQFYNNDKEPHYMLQMVSNRCLTKENSDRDVRHFELENPSSGITYQVGDALEILPSQSPSAVDSFIERCKLDPDCYITVMSFFATAEHEKEKLQYFASPEGRDDLYQYNQKEGRTILEVLDDFPSVQMPFEWLVQLTPPLKKRAFSISSSPLAKPNQIHLTVSIVSWRTPFKRMRRGLCSSWLAGLNPNEENLIPCWVHHGSLPPPHPSTPLILIGPGTGCAPFCAFVAERAAQSTSEATAPILFFFGCRNQENDFLYKDFWYAHAHDQGVLSSKNGGGFFVAFSRDQPQKVYVQHRIREQSARVWNLLKSGAAIYIAGSSTKMPADVTAALEEVICQETGCSEEEASIWLRKLERNGKFHTETWS